MASRNASETEPEVIVVGLGAIGSNVAWRLAQRGVQVLGIERFTPGHAQGSSHGHSRLFRLACLEHPNLVPMARRSRELWLELEGLTGRSIFDQTGAITIAPANHSLITGTLQAAAEHDLSIQHLSHDELSDYAAGHENVPDDWQGLWDPEGGVIRPEAGVLAAVEAAKAAGAQILTDTRVTAINLVDGGVEVVTPTATFSAPQVIVTAGAWLGKLVPDLPLQINRVPMIWFSPRDPEDNRFSIGNFPVFNRAIDQETSFWGHGSVYGADVKIGLSRGKNYRLTDPDDIDRAISPQDWQRVSDVLATRVPGLNSEPSKITTCLVTESPDDQFIIGRPNGDERIMIGGGDSGHAFKHATGIGELIAQLVTAEEPYLDPSFISLDRFDLDHT